MPGSVTGSQVSEIDPRVREILAEADLQPTDIRLKLVEILLEGPTTPRMAWQRLKESGIDCSIANVRYHLSTLAERGVAARRGSYYVLDSRMRDGGKETQKSDQKTILFGRATLIRR